MKDSEQTNGVIKPQNYYRFGKIDEVLLSGIRFTDQYPAYIIVECAKKVVFRNCYFPFGVIIYGIYDELVFDNSHVMVLSTAVDARKLVIMNDDPDSANRVAFRDSKFKFLADVEFKNAQVEITSLNDIYITNKVTIENTDFTISSCKFITDKLEIRGNVLFDMDSANLSYLYYPASTLTPKLRPGLTYKELIAPDGAKANFRSNWNSLIYLNDKEVDPKLVQLPPYDGMDDFFQRKGPGEEPGEAFCY